MTDTFDGYSSGLTAPITNATEVVPNDAADLPAVSRAIHVGGAGDLTVTMRDGTAPVTFAGIAAGWHPPAGAPCPCHRDDRHRHRRGVVR